MKRYEKYKNDIIAVAGCTKDRLSLIEDYHFKNCDDTACKNCLFRIENGACHPAAQIYELWDKICTIPANLNKLNVGVDKNNEVKSCNYIDCKDCILKDCNLAEYMCEDVLLPPIEKICRNIKPYDNSIILCKDGTCGSILFDKGKYHIKIDITKEEAKILRERYNTDVFAPIMKTLDNIDSRSATISAEIVEKLPRNKLQLHITTDFLEVAEN